MARSRFAVMALLALAVAAHASDSGSGDSIEVTVTPQPPMMNDTMDVPLSALFGKWAGMGMQKAHTTDGGASASCVADGASYIAFPVNYTLAAGPDADSLSYMYTNPAVSIGTGSKAMTLAAYDQSGTGMAVRVAPNAWCLGLNDGQTVIKLSLEKDGDLWTLTEEGITMTGSNTIIDVCPCGHTMALTCSDEQTFNYVISAPQDFSDSYIRAHNGFRYDDQPEAMPMPAATTGGRRMLKEL